MTNFKPYLLLIVIALVVGAIYFINSSSVKIGGGGEAIEVVPRDSSIKSGEQRSKSDYLLSSKEKSSRYELAKEITTPDGFINTDGTPIRIGDLVGKKIVLIDFWTYSCINCQRTTPYLNNWYEKYKDKGFVIVGVHTPEFEFEKNYKNVSAAVKKFGIKFPVVLDNDYSTWTAYRNRYWPRKYLIDIDGYIVYDHIGEGAYEETEIKIQEALAERMAIFGDEEKIDDLVTKEVAGKGGFRSPETYFGAARNQSFGNGRIGVIGKQYGLTTPAKIAVNTLYLSGDWNIGAEYAESNSFDSGIIYRYEAADVFFVAEADNETVLEILRDGQPLGDEAGADVERTDDGRTIVRVKKGQLYKIIEDELSETHTLELIIKDRGLHAYTFTFG